MPEKPTINDGKCTIKSTTACTHTKACYCLSRDEGGADGQAGGGGRGDMPKILPLSQTSKATPMLRYINGLTLDITVKTDV